MNTNELSTEDHMDGAVPVSKAVQTYEEVLEWPKYVIPSKTLPLQSRTQFSLKGSCVCCHLSPCMRHTRPNSETVPKTLVCHDYKGGYGEDKYINGSSKYNSYRFFHWAGIDIFVYFSHKLVTIPPPGWINAAHLHGVKILGTLITEWEEGKAIWNKILSSNDSRRTFVSCLIDISDSFGFDGYLLNVENALQQEQVELIVTFIQELHEGLKQRLPNSQLIWYDSVTTTGELKWQNELNEKNSTFFDHCDGIFLNYGWKRDNLQNSKHFAGSRLRDVYVGVDVFGRNCFSGGGFNTCQALEVVRDYDLSVAVFAPGWVHEALDTKHFTCFEHIFWQRLWPYLYIHGPAELPFSSSFCQGFGLKLYKNGNVINSDPWYNLTLQHHQPSVSSCLGDFCSIFPSKDCEGYNKGCVQHCTDDAFEGGGCLKICKTPEICEDEILHRLLLCDFNCTGYINVVVVTKLTPPSASNLELLFIVQDLSGNCNQISVQDGYNVYHCPDSKKWIKTEETNKNGKWKAWYVLEESEGQFCRNTWTDHFSFSTSPIWDFISIAGLARDKTG